MARYLKGAGVGGLIAAVVLGGLFASKEHIAGLIWEKFKWGSAALVLSTENAFLAWDIGNYYFNAFGSGVHNLEMAKRAYHEALRRDSDLTVTHYQLGRIYFIEGDFYKALEEIKKEIEINPGLPNSYYMMGLIYGFRGLPGDLEKAEEGFKRAVEGIPDGWAGYNDLAWVQIKSKKFEDAKKTIQKAFKRLPYTQETNVWLWTALGVAELNMGYYEDAQSAFFKAEEIVANMTPEYFWSAYPGNDSRNADEAFRQFTSTLDFNLGVVHEKLKEWHSAIGYYEKYLAQLPEGPYPQKKEVELKIQELYAHTQ